MSDLTVIIPAYNEGKTIRNVIREVLKTPRVGQVIVIDDASQDDTSLHINKFKDKITFIQNEKNRGKGYSVRRGLEKAILKYTIIQDADLELSPASYSEMFKALEETEADMINGRRSMAVNDVKLISKIAALVVPVSILVLYGRWVKDVVCCYKLMETKKYKELELSSDRFELETEIILKAIRKKYKIREKEVVFSPRSVKEGKHVRWTDGLKVLKLIFKYRLGLKT